MCEELRLEWPALAAALSTGPPDAVASALRKAGRAVDAAQSACAWPRQLQLRRRLLLACDSDCNVEQHRNGSLHYSPRSVALVRGAEPLVVAGPARAARHLVEGFEGVANSGRDRHRGETLPKAKERAGATLV